MQAFTDLPAPALTAMLQGRDPERILYLMQLARTQGADAYGFQLEQLEPRWRTPAVYKVLFQAVQGKPVYVTSYRTQLNTGRSDEDCLQDLLQAAHYGGTLFDIPADSFHPEERQFTQNPVAIARQQALIRQLHDLGKTVVLSSHTGCYLSPQDILILAQEQLARGADLAKIVSRADTATQLQQQLQASLELQRQLRRPFLFLCTGNYARLQRMLNPLLGSRLFLCVAEHDALSTPEQPTLAEARSVLQLCGLRSG
ncbi:MAG: type I 3-dehydroquinate dehydratase [Oscillospiraceae bacterium]|nr:type I 3-dehydroquinate dehydratase [Oscillospiraceae bacterium]